MQLNMIESGNQLAQTQENIRNEMDLQLSRNKDLEKRTENFLVQVEKLQHNVVAAQRQENEKLVKTLKLDQQRLTDFELRLRKVESLQTKLETMDLSVNQASRNIEELKQT